MINAALMMLTTARCYNILPKTTTIWHLRKQSYRCHCRRSLATSTRVRSEALNFFIVHHSYPLQPRATAATTNGTSGMPAIPMSTTTNCDCGSVLHYRCGNLPAFMLHQFFFMEKVAFMVIVYSLDFYGLLVA